MSLISLGRCTTVVTSDAAEAAAEDADDANVDDVATLVDDVDRGVTSVVDELGPASLSTSIDASTSNVFDDCAASTNNRCQCCSTQVIHSLIITTTKRQPILDYRA